MLPSNASTGSISDGCRWESGTSIFDGVAYIGASFIGGSNVTLSSYTGGGGGFPGGGGGGAGADGGSGISIIRNTRPNEKIYQSLVLAFTSAPIGLFSNNISKGWHSDKIVNGTYEEQCHIIDCIKRLCCQSNYCIDYA